MPILKDETIKVTKYAVAPLTTIEWNPVDNTGRVTFHVQVEVHHDGVFSHFENGNPLVVSLDEVLGKTFSVGGNDVPALLVMGAIKAAFDTFYVEKVGL